jgi:protein-S-isoprenylcysteine O-methyltransferase Ste14
LYEYTGSDLFQLALAAEVVAETACIIAALVPSERSARILSTLTTSQTATLVDFAPSWAWVLGTAISVAGGFFRLSVYRELGRQFTFELALFKDHKLVTSGPFSIVRHPSYTGLLAIFWGSALALAAPGSWTRQVLIDNAIYKGFMSGPSWVPWARALGGLVMLLQAIASVGFLDRTLREDEMLRERFGKQWDDWVQRTPYRLLPGIY